MALPASRKPGKHGAPCGTGGHGDVRVAQLVPLKPLLILK
jgi:hypothetical protein